MLVILGILAAVAVPKYIDMATEAKGKASQAQIAEMKSSLNMAYYRVHLKTGRFPKDNREVLEEMGVISGTSFNVGALPDLWHVKLTVAGGKPKQVKIKIEWYGGESWNVRNKYVAESEWNFPE